MAAAYTDMSWVMVTSVPLTSLELILSVLICQDINVVLGKETIYFIWIVSPRPASWRHSRLVIFTCVKVSQYCNLLQSPSFSFFSSCGPEMAMVSLQCHEFIPSGPWTCSGNSFHGSLIQYSVFCTKLTFCPEGGAHRKPMECPKWNWAILRGAWSHHLNVMTYILTFPVVQVHSIYGSAYWDALKEKLITNSVAF